MSQKQNILLDAALITSGIGTSTFFVSVDGNGQNPLPVAAGLLCVAGITALVSFLLSRLIHNLLVAILATIALTDFLFIAYFINSFAFSRRTPEHGDEELVMLPIVFVVATAPTVILASVGFGRLANRFFRRKDTNS